MSDRPPPAHIPTLTEVVTRSPAAVSVVAPVPAPPPAAATIAPATAAMPANAAVPAPAHAPAPMAALTTRGPSEGELVDRVVAHLQRQVDQALEVRLREVLAPVLARATDTVVREARRELTSVMRELVARAIADELARRRRP